MDKGGRDVLRQLGHLDSAMRGFAGWTAKGKKAHLYYKNISGGRRSLCQSLVMEKWWDQSFVGEVDNWCQRCIEGSLKPLTTWTQWNLVHMEGDGFSVLRWVLP